MSTAYTANEHEVTSYDYRNPRKVRVGAHCRIFKTANRARAYVWQAAILDQAEKESSFRFLLTR